MSAVRRRESLIEQYIPAEDPSYLVLHDAADYPGHGLCPVQDTPTSQSVVLIHKHTPAGIHFEDVRSTYTVRHTRIMSLPQYT